MVEEMDRRKFIEGAASAALGASLAGCNEDTEPNDQTTDTPQETEQDETGEPEFDLNVEIPEEFEEGENIESAIKIENTGNAPGEYTTGYQIENGEPEEGQITTETLEPGETENFNLTEIIGEVEKGNYTFTVGTWDNTTEFNVLPEMFTWEDILESEEKRHRKIAEDNHAGVENISLADQSIRDADPRDYDEILDAILQTNMDVTQGLGDRGVNEDSTSANMSEALGVVNTLLIENDIDARQMNGPTAGHGYGLVIFRDHPFSLADSNWPVAGPVEERVLQDRPNSDAYDRIGSRIINTDYDDLDDADKRAARRLIKQGIMIEDAPRRWNDISHTDVHPDVVDSYLESYFDDDGDFIFDKFRHVLGSLKMAAAEGYVDGHGQLITSTADELPKMPDDQEQYSDFVDNLLDEHVEIYSEERYNEELDEEWRN